MTTIKIKYKLIVHPVLKCLGYYKDGKFVEILSRGEYEQLEIIRGGEWMKLERKDPASVTAKKMKKEVGKVKIIYDDGELEIIISRGKSNKSFVFADDDEVEQIYKGIEVYRDTISELADNDDMNNLRMEFEINEKEDC